MQTAEQVVPPAPEAAQAPELPSAPPVRESLTANDARALRRYLAGSALFAPRGTSLGDLLERAANFSTIFPCRRCGGTGRCPQSGTYAQAMRTWRRKEIKRLKLVVSASGKGGELLKMLDIQVRVYTPQEANEIVGPLPEAQTIKCPERNGCNGTGVVAGVVSGRRNQGPITARPTGSSVRGSTAHINMGNPQIAAYGRVSRRLRVVRSKDPIGCAALERYHAPGGSYGAVWILTDAAQVMLADNPLGIHYEQVFTRIVEQEHEKHDATRGALITQANTEAGVLVRRGARAWNYFGPLELASGEEPEDRLESEATMDGPLFAEATDKAFARHSADEQDMLR